MLVQHNVRISLPALESVLPCLEETISIPPKIQELQKQSSILRRYTNLKADSQVPGELHATARAPGSHVECLSVNNCQRSAATEQVHHWSKVRKMTVGFGVLAITISPGIIIFMQEFIGQPLQRTGRGWFTAFRLVFVYVLKWGYGFCFRLASTLFFLIYSV